MKKTLICLLAVFLPAVACAQNITQELNADLNEAFRDILPNSAMINNSTQPSTASPFVDVGSIDSDADFIAAEQQFNSFASLNPDELRQASEMWHLYLIESGKMPWIPPTYDPWDPWSTPWGTY